MTTPRNCNKAQRARRFTNTFGYLLFKMASSGYFTVTDSQIAKLSQEIPSQDMATIAIKYLGFDHKTIENLMVSHHDDPIGFNRYVLIVWRNKTVSRSQVQVSQIGMK